MKHPHRRDHLRVQHTLTGRATRVAGLVVPRLMIQRTGRCPRRRETALARLRAIAPLAGTTLLVPPLSLTLDGQRRMQSNRVHPATPETQPLLSRSFTTRSLSLSRSRSLSLPICPTTIFNLYDARIARRASRFTQSDIDKDTLILTNLVFSICIYICVCVCVIYAFACCTRL